MLAMDLPAFAKWMATLMVAILVVGTTSAGTINLVSSQTWSRAAAVDPSPSPAMIRTVAPIAEIKPVGSAAPAAKPATVSATTPVAASPRAQAAPTKPQMMATLSLAVRAHPQKASQQIGGIEQGEIVTVSSKDGGWMLVTTSDGESGWAYGKYLTAVDPHIVADSPFWKN
jgi:uncharacterized protein YgiM (DUF1202 family)